MTAKTIEAGGVKIGPEAPLTIIAGPCVLESEQLALQVGEQMRDHCAELGLNYIFKASFDKANRSSISSKRGPGMAEGLKTLASVRKQLGVPVTTDIHEPEQAAQAADAGVDLLQIPAFLCRQTDLLVAAGETGASVNVKKGQFLSPSEMSSVVLKLEASGCENVMLTERGTFFGYQRLVNDFIGVVDMGELGYPLCFDATHSTQLPGAGGGPAASGASGDGRVTAGRPERAAMLARCAVVAGVHAVFIETHPEPAKGMSDAATMLPLDQTKQLLVDLQALWLTMINRMVDRV